MAKVKVVKKSEPVVSMEQILRYETGRPETSTGERLVDAVLDLLQDRTILAGGQVTERMGLTRQYLSCALVVLTGYSTSDIRTEIIAKRWREYRKAHPKCKVEELAKELGFYDHTSLWRFIERNKQRFPELFRAEDAPNHWALSVVEEIMPQENEYVRRAYVRLPYKGPKEEREACLRQLYRHSRLVADLAMEIALRHPIPGRSIEMVEEAALLHNIGIVWTNTPALHCHGTEHYINHGQLAMRWLSTHGRQYYALAVAHHLGSGIEPEEMQAAGYPVDFYISPSNPLDRLLCYATCFYSAFDPEHRRTVEEVREYLSRFGTAAVERFDELHRMFG